MKEAAFKNLGWKEKDCWNMCSCSNVYVLVTVFPLSLQKYLCTCTHGCGSKKEDSCIYCEII